MSAARNRIVQVAVRGSILGLFAVAACSGEVRPGTATSGTAGTTGAGGSANPDTTGTTGTAGTTVVSGTAGTVVVGTGANATFGTASNPTGQYIDVTLSGSASNSTIASIFNGNLNIFWGTADCANDPIAGVDLATTPGHTGADPEPASFVIVLGGLAAIVAVRRRLAVGA